MKTIVIAHNYNENSFAAMSCNLAHHLAELGNRVIFISHKPYFPEKQVIKKGKGEVVLCSWSTKNRPTSIKDFIWFAKIYWQYKPDTVIGHFVGSNITAVVSKGLSFGKTKTLVYCHTLSNAILTDSNKRSFKQKLLYYRKKKFYQLFCDRIICPSAMGKKDLEDYYSIDKGVVVLNPMTDRFTGKSIISNQNIVISYLGRLDPTKGVLDLIKAFEIYKSKVPQSIIKLNIAGSGTQEAEIMEVIKHNPSVQYWGALSYDKVDDYLNKSHFTIIPSKFDNLPTVGLESMMNQTPLLISNTTGLTEYLSEGKECYKFDASVEALVSVFEKVESNFESQEQMGRCARETFKTKFSMAEYCINFSKLIE
jgi:glycosyltransferase involved in cell wall biosynthesis